MTGQVPYMIQINTSLVYLSVKSLKRGSCAMLLLSKLQCLS